MTLPRYCKICRLMLHYPSLVDKDYDTFNGNGHCPENHYKVLVHDSQEESKVLEETLHYNEYVIFIDYHNEKHIEIFKESKIVLETTLESFENVNFRDKDYVINKLDTLVNFS